jgi:hypothetical protein
MLASPPGLALASCRPLGHDGANAAPSSWDPCNFQQCQSTQPAPAPQRQTPEAGTRNTASQASNGADDHQTWGKVSMLFGLESSLTHPQTWHAGCTAAWTVQSL